MADVDSSVQARVRELGARGRRLIVSSALVGVALLVGASAVVAASIPRDSVPTSALAVPPELPDCTEPAPFPDVPITHPFCPEIKWMKDNAISTGFEDGTYRPSINVSRQAMSAFLARLAGSTPGACTTAPFNDVATNHPFCKEIQWMKDNAISTGFPGPTYQPSSNVTRQAMSAFLARMAGATPAVCVAGSPPFPDVPVEHPFCKEIKWMKDNAISTGFPDGTYQPAANVTRQAMSAFLYRASFLIGKVPVVTLSIGSAGYVEDGPAVTIDGGLTVTDVDDADLISGEVAITAGRDTGDVLALPPGHPQISSAYNSGTGVLTLTGPATVSYWQSALRTVTFSTTNNTPGPSRTIAFKVKDNALYSDVKTRQVLVAANNDAPVADDETFNATNSAVGNTALVVNDPTDPAPTQPDPKKSISGDLLAGDSDVDGPGPLVITSVGLLSTNNGGTVTLDTDGDFVYVSDPADFCTPTFDFFDYTVSDQGSPARTDVGRVTIALSGCVWYVSNNATGNSGTSIGPFDTLAQAQTASQPSHTIFVFDGDNTTLGYDAGITLQNNQRLLGETVNLTLPNPEHTGVTLWTATANRPTITDTNADVIELASGNEVRGLEINPSGTGGGIAGGSPDTSGTIADVRIIDTGLPGQQPNLELNATAGTWDISDLTINSTGAMAPPNSAKGVYLQSAGTVNFLSAGTISVATGGAAALDANATNMGTSVFDLVLAANSTLGGVSLVNTTGSTQLGDGVGIDLSLTTTGGAQAALLISNGGSISVPASGTATADISATGGPAVHITGGSGVSALPLDAVSSTNSATTGIQLNGLTTGTFSAESGSITNAAGTAFSVSGGAGNISYPGALGDGAGASVSISSRTAGTITLSGAIQDGPDAGGGISLTGNTGGSTVISNATKTVNTGSSPALVFNSSTGHTLTLSGGGLDIDTTSGNGVEALNSGTLNISGANNSITTITGTALLLSNVAGTVSLADLDKNGNGTGILLDNVTAAVTIPSGATIQNTSIAAVDINAGTGAFSYGGTIANAAGRTVEVTNRNTGSPGLVSFTGAVSSTGGTGTGINLDNNDNGTVTFGGGLNISTGANNAFTAINGGTVTVTGAGNVLTTTAGTALRIENTTIGAAGVTFHSISANGAVNGIVLTGTGSGPLTVTGDGSLARNGSGGNITNTTDDGIRLTNTNNVTLRSINLNSPGDTLQPLIEDNEDETGEHGIEAIGVSNLILSGVLVDGPAGSGIIGRNLTGTNRLNQDSLITNIDNPATHGIFLRNNSGSNLTLFEVNDSNFTNSSSGASTFNATNEGTANMTIEIRNGCIFEALSSQAVTMAAGANAGATGTLTSLVTGNTFRNAVASEPSPGVFVTSENNVAAVVANGAIHNATISNNLFDNIAEDGRVANTSIIRTQNAGGKLTVTVSGNTVQNINFQTSAGGRHVIGHVFEPVSYNAAYFSDLMFINNVATNVTFTSTNREFIFVDYRDGASGGDVTITGNNWNMPTSAATSEAIDLNFTQANPSTVNLLVDGNGLSGGATSNTGTRFLRIDSEDASTLHATVTDNVFTNSNGAPGTAIDFNTSDNVADAFTPTMCVNVSNNNVTAAGNTIRLNEAVGNMIVTQASAAAVAAANAGASVTVVGTPTFGQAACTLP